MGGRGIMMKYSVAMYLFGDSQPETWRDDLSKKEAEEMARTWAKENPNNQVFISWSRKSDGQKGYLNPDGNHAITGKAW
jgi:hypothetical protein